MWLVTFLHEVSGSGVVLCLENVLGLKLIQHENSTQGRGLTAETREKWRESERDENTSSLFRDKKFETTYAMGLSSSHD